MTTQYLYGEYKTIQYRLTMAIDSLDNNPETIIFDSFCDCEDYYYNEISRRVAFTVSHSPFSLTDEDIQDLEESEQQLLKIEKIELIK